MSISDHLTYDGFGQISWQSSATDQPRFGYDGMPFVNLGDASDPVAPGLYIDGKRPDDPTSDDFIQPDPSGFPSGQTNENEYCWNSPTNYVDPTGEAAMIFSNRGKDWAKGAPGRLQQSNRDFQNGIAPPGRDALDNTSDFFAGFADTASPSPFVNSRLIRWRYYRQNDTVNTHSFYYNAGKVAAYLDIIGIIVAGAHSGGGGSTTPVRPNPKPAATLEPPIVSNSLYRGARFQVRASLRLAT